MRARLLSLIGLTTLSFSILESKVSSRTTSSPSETVIVKKDKNGCLFFSYKKPNFGNAELQAKKEFQASMSCIKEDTLITMSNNKFKKVKETRY